MIGYLVIDVSKKTIDCHLIFNDKERQIKLMNSAAGFMKLQQWLDEFQISELHACYGGYRCILAGFGEFPV